eukprot:GHVQ01025968.1.p2 GENE.GHVQ01025968.1~~GHVQ01025968.1.p2  ORF type:complete len:632 (+),score=88.96 GHVQ01025968.1:3305-5200(+)
MGMLHAVVKLSCCALAAATLLLLTSNSPVSASLPNRPFSIRDAIKTPAEHTFSQLGEVEAVVVLDVLDSMVGLGEVTLGVLSELANRQSGTNFYDKYLHSCVTSILEKFNAAWASNFPGENNVLMTVEKPLKVWINKLVDTRNKEYGHDNVLQSQNEKIQVDPELQDVLRKIGKAIQQSGLQDIDVVTDIFLGTFLDMRLTYLDATDVDWRNLPSCDKTRAAALVSILSESQHGHISFLPAVVALDERTQQMEDSEGLARSKDGMTGPSATDGVTVTEVAESVLKILAEVRPEEAETLQAPAKDWMTRASLMTSGTNLLEEQQFFRLCLVQILNVLSSGEDPKTLRLMSISVAKTVFGVERASELIPVHQPSRMFMTGPMEILMYTMMGDALLNGSIAIQVAHLVSFEPLEKMKKEGTTSQWNEWTEGMVVVGKKHEASVSQFKPPPKHFDGFWKVFGESPEVTADAMSEVQQAQLEDSMSQLSKTEHVVGVWMMVLSRRNTAKKELSLDIMSEDEAKWIVTGMSVVLNQGAWDKKDYNKVLEWLLKALHEGANLVYYGDCPETGDRIALTKNGEEGAEEYEKSDLRSYKNDETLSHRVFDYVKVGGPANVGGGGGWRYLLPSDEGQAGEN